MEIILGKYAGFCYGVSRAIAIVERESKDKQVCTYGSIINNREVTKNLEDRGIFAIDNLDCACDKTVVIRSHGVPPSVYGELEAKGISYVDATCKDVLRIHDIVKQNIDDGRKIIICGDDTHPEIVGIKGFANDTAIMIKNLGAIENINFDKLQKYALVVQTTFIEDEFLKIVERLEKLQLDIKVYSTICASMANRQKEAYELSNSCDAMVVIGDKKSSNSIKLYDICKTNCKNTYFIETFRDLVLNNFVNSVKIGIVAGASTPPHIIKEAFCKMSELENGTEETMQSFEDMLNESLVTLKTGEIVKGTVIGVVNGEVSVNLGFKSDGLIPRVEFSEDPNVEPDKLVFPGDEIEVFVIRVNDGEGNVLLSKKKIDAKKGYDELDAAFEAKTPISGKIIEIVKGGLIANVKGVRVFVPSSQISNRFVEDLNVFKGQVMDFEILELDKVKRRIVGGRKALAALEQNAAREKMYETLEIGQELEGVVSRVADFGAFVDIGDGVDGLIHISELSWARVKKVSDVLNQGDKVNARVLEINKEKGKISLSLKGKRVNPWETINEKYAVGDVVTGAVVRMADFGAFVSLEDGVDGLIHISQISQKRITKPQDVLTVGQTVTAKIMDIIADKQRVSLSMKALEAPEVAAAAEEAGQEETFKVPASVSGIEE